MSAASAKLKQLEHQLQERGLTGDERKRIHDSRICVIDDKIDQLQGLLSGLRREGYTNLVERSQVSSVNEILNGGFDLILLDLAGIALDVDREDGLGVLQKLKETEPLLPVIVITGNHINPNFVKRVNAADLVIHKPVLSADLAKEIESLLKLRKHPGWGAVKVLRELDLLEVSGVSRTLSFWDRLRLRRRKDALLNKALDGADGSFEEFAKMAELLGKYAGAIAALGKLCATIANLR